MFNTKNNQQGVSLFLTILILSVLMAALLALLTVSISQIKILQSVGDAAVAFYAADTGIERVLYALYQEDYTPTATGCPPAYSGGWGSGWDAVSYEVCITALSPLQIYSNGVYRDTKRRIEINFD